jgi:hypothetical protein
MQVEVDHCHSSMLRKWNLALNICQLLRVAEGEFVKASSSDRGVQEEEQGFSNADIRNQQRRLPSENLDSPHISLLVSARTSRDLATKPTSTSLGVETKGEEFH